MQVRRVVTGHDNDGKSVFVADELVSATSFMPGATSFHELWRADSPPTFPSPGHNGAKTRFFPLPGGYRFMITTYPPGDGHGDLTGVDFEALLREVEEKLPGLLDVNEADNPGMHTTDSVDLEIVLSGELVLELDDGAETTLRTGDVNIQNGTRHRWHNRGDVPATLACVMIAGTRR